MTIGFAVFFVSFAVLGYEILLMRLLSITQWNHFAYMIISLALLGFGASGTFTCVLQDRLLSRFHTVFCSSALLFSLTIVGCFAISQSVPLNPLEILWDARQWLYLFQTYFILFLPFFFAGSCLSLAFLRFKEQIHRLYFFDLLGAGLGALGMILLLFSFTPSMCLRLLSAPGFVAAGLVQFGWKRRGSIIRGSVHFLCGISLPFLWPHGWAPVRISEYKGLSMALRAPNASIIDERSSPLGWLAVVESPSIPFRHAPGMSLNCSSEPPPQLGVFVDGDALSPITHYDGSLEPLSFLGCTTSALPFHLLKEPQVLVLGAGGGMDVLMAKYHGAHKIDAVELDANMVSLVKDTYGEFAGNLYGDGSVRVHVAEARGFVARTSKNYDLILVSLLDSFNASAAGGYALSESYLYTVEALQDFYRHLNPGGCLSITRWLKVPPRDSLKLFATAVAALEQSGVPDASRQLALIRSWKTTTLLVKNGRLTDHELANLRSFCEERAFDIDYCPGIQQREPNRFNILDQPYMYEGALALLSQGRAEFTQRYKFFIEPATDDRPYFFHFFKWGTLPEILSLRGQGGLPLIEWTYPILVLTLLQALVLSFVLILLPLFFFRGRAQVEGARGRIAVYFLALGFAFLFVEIAFIQKLILFLSHPLYAVSVVLFSFLVFAGLGSSASRYIGQVVARHLTEIPGAPILLAVLGIILLLLLYAGLFPMLFKHYARLQDAGRIAISIGLLAPLAFFMGMPFPLGLSLLAERRASYIPWAWGINGCASVLGTVFATLLAIHMGFNAVVLIAAVLYGLAAMAFWYPLPSHRPAGNAGAWGNQGSGSRRE